MSPRNAWRFLQRVFASLRVADASPPRPQEPLVLFSCHDVDRAMRDDAGKRYSPLLEGIRALIEVDGVRSGNLSHPYAVFDGREIKDGAITINRRALRIRVTSLLHRLLRGKQFARTMRLDAETAMYARLLEEWTPRAVISIQPPPGLCRAARRAGIRMIEAMHGTNISLADPVFCAHMRGPDELLPDTLLAFDDVTQATLESLCAGRDIAPLRAADPWMHRLAWLREQNPGSSEPPMPKSRHSSAVLVTLQWGYDGERDSLAGIVPNGILHPALEDAIARVGADGIAVYVRMHPIQMNAAGYRRHRQYIEALPARLSHVEVERSSRIALPLLLEHVEGHVTMSSSAVGEAAVAGVPSLLLCPTLHPGGAHDGLFRELEASGMAVFGTLDAGAIAAWMRAARRSAPAAEGARDFAARHERALATYRALLGAQPTTSQAAA